MSSKIIEKIKNYVEEECKKPTSKYGYEPFTYHFAPTAKYAEKLADELNADKEIVIIASWLHDIGSIIHGREDHHITGSEIAEEKLKEFGYPQEKIDLVKKCIFNHRGSKDGKGKTLEEKILIEADTLSAFENISGIFKAAFVYENKDQKSAQKAVKRKLQNKWKQLHFEKSREIIKPRYEAAMLLLTDLE